MTEAAGSDAVPAPPTPEPSLARAALVGAAGFGAASLAVFATVAFAERWMYENLGVGGAYAAWTALFVLLGGAALWPLADRSRTTMARFYARFALAFAAYAAAWVAAYFVVRGPAGEWLGALAGALALGAVLAAGNGPARQWASAATRLGAILFAAHCAGYFAGAALDPVVGRPAGMLLWGALYGVCLGAGLGVSLWLLRRRAAAPRARLPSADPQG